MKINIIGGSGFIGNSLYKRLKSTRKSPIKILDKVLSVEFPQATSLCDVRFFEQLSAALDNNSIIINLAAEHRDNVHPTELYYEVNVDGASNICLVAREKNIKKIIFTSTVAVYGFAPPGTDEGGIIAPFHDYGKSKYAAEKIFREWQAELPHERSLIIIRPTVVFGEKNRGNVYNLFKQIASGRFLMIGNGFNRKSMAYVENVAAFIDWSIDIGQGVHVFNYVDKPDFTMNQLVSLVNKFLGRSAGVGLKLPYRAGYLIGLCFDVISKISGNNYPISGIRVKKFCANSVYGTSAEITDFTPPFSIEEALKKTINYEFIESHPNANIFYAE